MRRPMKSFEPDLVRNRIKPALRCDRIMLCVAVACLAWGRRIGEQSVPSMAMEGTLSPFETVSAKEDKNRFSAVVEIT